MSLRFCFARTLAAVVGLGMCVGLGCTSASDDPIDGDGDQGGSGSGTGGSDSGDGDGDTAGSGGDTDTGTSGEALKLVEHYPLAGDGNANAFLPITLRFSADVDEKTVQDAFTLQVADRRLDFTVDVDGPDVHIHLDEIPALPARVGMSVDSSLRSKDGARFAGDSWTFQYPLWQTPTGEPISGGDGIDFCELDDGSLLLVTERAEKLAVQILKEETWHDVASPTSQSARLLDLASSDDGERLLWLDGVTVHSALWKEDDGWDVEDTAIAVPEGAEIVVAQAEDGVVALAWADGEKVQIRELVGGSVEALPVLNVGEEISELSVATSGAGTFMAIVTSTRDIDVFELGDAAWQAVGPRIMRQRDAGDVLPRLRSDDQLYLAYLDGDEKSNHALIKTFDGAWVQSGPALDLVLDGEVTQLAMELFEGSPTVAWIEKEEGPRRLLVARDDGDGFRIMGQAAMEGVGNEVDQLELSLGKAGFPIVGVRDPKEARLRRFNGSSVLPAGLSSRGDVGDCRIPEDGPGFPAKVSDTGCYSNVNLRRLVEGAIPYNINSALWTDGAAKRRFVVVPEDEVVGYTETGALDFPVGTLLIKEFLIERVTGNPDSLAIMETRFFTKRCDVGDCQQPWQGYSYQWNDEGTDAHLLPDESAVKAWDITTDGAPAIHEHFYPSRQECLNCHLPTVGGANGPQAAQLNRPQVYGDFIDNQLRTWEHIGLLVGAPNTEPETRDRIPPPADVSQPLQERVAGYFHANCSHCHQPQGAAGARVLDFRYFGTGLNSLICEPAQDSPTGVYPDGSVYIHPGQPDSSLIYMRAAARDGLGGPVGLQMPPLGTLVTDTQQLTLLEAWIDSLQGSCD